MIENHRPVPRSDVEDALLESIRTKTGGRIRSLAVDVHDGRIGVRGQAASFHLKQLVICAILDVIGSVETMRIELDIVVDDIETRPKSDGFSDAWGSWE